jgi:pimeloyl-ACP methyl ester carboxylesterase
MQGERFRTTYVRLGSKDAEGLLYEPLVAANGKSSRIALVYSHPNGNTFTEPLGAQMAQRGYRVLMVNYRGIGASDDAYAPSISRGISYLRTLPGVRRVVIVGHSGGGHLVALYQNAAEHGPSVCQAAEKIFPCRGDLLRDLERPDGMILLDPTLGAFHQMSAVDPAIGVGARNPAIDMFSAQNGYDSTTGRAAYSAEFAARFYAAQAARNTAIVSRAAERLRAIGQGAGEFSDDEPLVIAGMGVNAAGARLYQPDTSFLARTKRPHRLLRPDGSDVQDIIQSVRAPSGRQAQDVLGTLNAMSQNTTVVKFLAASAIRTTAEYSITADDILGVDWASAMTSTPANAEGIGVPALVLVMSCHYLVVPGEIIFDHLGSNDKTYAAVEGATHLFAPCKPEYGDTMARTFDFVADWIATEGRF